jgi:transposase
MGKSYKVSSEEAAIIREKMKSCNNVVAYRKMQAVALRGEGKSNLEAGEITKYHPDYVSILVSTYCRKGLDAISEDFRKGGNNQNISYEKEKEILDSFKSIAEKGQIITPAEIKIKYDEAVGRETKPSFIYKVLKRHDWRKVMPRSKHPNKASEEEIESSKKLTP